MRWRRAAWGDTGEMLLKYQGEKSSSDQAVGNVRVGGGM